MASSAPNPLSDVSNVQRAPAAAQGKAQKRQREDVANDDDADAPQVDAPAGFIAIHGFADELWSKDALELVDTMTAEAAKRDPEAHNIALFGSFYCYALYDLIEGELHKFNVKMRKNAKDRDTFVLLEAITFFIAVDEGTFEGIDDGDRFEAFAHLFAAAWHTLAARLHTAKPDSLLPDIPNASNVILTAARIIMMWDEMLSGELKDVVTLLQIMLCRDGLPYQLKKVCIRGEDGEKPSAERMTKKPKIDNEIEHYAEMTFRKAEKEFDVSAEAPYNFANLWREYSQVHRGQGLAVLFRYVGDAAPVGGWDITRWGAEARVKFSYDRFNDEDSS